MCSSGEGGQARATLGVSSLLLLPFQWPYAWQGRTRWCRCISERNSKTRWTPSRVACVTADSTTHTVGHSCAKSALRTLPTCWSCGMCRPRFTVRVFACPVTYSLTESTSPRLLQQSPGLLRVSLGPGSAELLLRRLDVPRGYVELFRLLTAVRVWSRPGFSRDMSTGTHGIHGLRPVLTGAFAPIIVMAC